MDTDNSVTQILKLSTLLMLLSACNPGAHPDGDQSDAGDTPLGGAPDADQRSFALLPDTQFYACAYPEIFNKQTEFLRDEKDTFGLGIVLHTGDIVDNCTAAQWRVAADALHRLDGHISYMLVPGNHDISSTRETALNQYFKRGDMSTGHVRIQQREEGRLDNSYAIVHLRGEPWLFLGLEFAPRDQTLRWAASVLDAHLELPTVIFTHAYLYHDGNRYDRNISPPQRYHPDSYQVTPEQGIGDGQDIWSALVEPYEQVRLVLSGHVIPDGVARSEIQRQSGSVVHELLTNYQRCDTCPCAEVEGGGGYLRIFELSEDRRALSVTTRSPYLEESLDDAENRFEISW